MVQSLHWVSLSPLQLLLLRTILQLDYIVAMLRNLLPSEPELVRLISLRAWDEVRLRVQTHPREAAPNHSANRGIGPTALSAAVRGGAQLDTIKVLTEANLDQLVRVRHYRNGTVLHEAIKHRSSISVILYFIRTIIKYEREQNWMNRGELKPVNLDFSHGGSPIEVICQTQSQAFRDERCSDSPNRVNVHSTIFNQTDDLGRTPLHHLVVRASASQSRDCRDNMMRAVQKLAHAFPPAVGRQDNDGFTPLDLALVTENSNSLGQAMEIEMRVFGLINILIKEYPMAAHPSINHFPAQARLKPDSTPNMIPGRQLQPRSRSLSSTLVDDSRQQGQSIIQNRRALSDRVLSETITGNIKHNPLSHALMHGRHFSSIELLMEASRSSHTTWHTGHFNCDWNDNQNEGPQSHGVDQCCMTIVSRDFEIPLHIAVTMRASSDVVRHVLLAASDAAAVPDRCDLTPICWTWMRFVIDEMERHPNVPSRPPLVRASKRRYIPSNFPQASEFYTDKMYGKVHELCSEIKRLGFHSEAMFQENEIEREMRLKILYLLPCAAESLSTLCPEKSVIPGIESVTEWSPLHSAAFLVCPRAVVLQSIASNTSNLRKKDSLGNTPLHLLVAREVYTKEILLGVTSAPHRICEHSAVPDLLSLYPNATEVINNNGQLPLHIAIDFEKKQNARKPNDDMTSCSSRLIHQAPSPIHSNAEEMKKTLERSTALYLAQFDPGSLEIKDGLTGLYPALQAAAGPSSVLDIVFSLLRECPSLV